MSSRKLAQKKTKNKLKKLNAMKDDPVIKAVNIPGSSRRTGLIPQKLDSDSTKFKMTPLMEKNIILRYPFSMCFIGRSGCGKTTTMIWMIQNLYKNYFEEIYFISPTAGVDDLVKHLDLKESNVISSDIINRTKELVSKRKKMCEKKGPTKCKRALYIFDDISSQRKLMASEEFLQAYVQLRHLGASVISCSHKFKCVPRLARLSSNGFILFPCPATEVKAMCDELCPFVLNKKEFSDMVRYAWEPDDTTEYPFLFVNKQVKCKERYRKGFHSILQLN